MNLSDVCKITNNHISRVNLFFLPRIKRSRDRIVRFCRGKYDLLG